MFNSVEIEINHSCDRSCSYCQNSVDERIEKGSMTQELYTEIMSQLKSLNYNGTVTACGMVASLDLNTSILPFILRGVKLIGIDSVQQPSENKDKIWQLLADQWKPTVLKELITEIGLEQLREVLNRVLDGKAVGRYVVQHI